MIIFGWRGVTLSGESGSFHCPSCAGERTYRRKNVRRFFTLYFVPVIPLNKVGEYVECASCGGQFKSEVLSMTSARLAEEFRNRMSVVLGKVVSFALMVDGPPSKVRVAASEYLYTRISGAGQFKPPSSAIALSPQPVPWMDLQSIAPQLNDHGKELFIKAAIFVARADGVLSEPALQGISTMARSLDMTPAHVAGIASSIN